jgi:hypothetical protein
MATARYHKVKIGEHELNAETLMLGDGYDPSLSESAARWPAASRAPCQPQGKFPNADPIRHGPHDRDARGRLPRPPRTGFPALLTWRLAALPLLYPALSRHRKKNA